VNEPTTTTTPKPAGGWLFGGSTDTETKDEGMSFRHLPLAEVKHN